MIRERFRGGPVRSIFQIGYGCALFKMFGIVVYCILLSGCSGFACSHDKGMESTSADQTVTASVVEISCGAPAKDATWVTLHRTGDKYDRHDDVIFSAAQQHPVELKWLDDSRLSIDCRCSEKEILFQVIKIGGTNIAYK
jgi:hypothetical protein